MIDNKIQEYAESHTTPESPVLYDLNRQTHIKVLRPRMLSGHLQGEFLKMFSGLVKPRRILEVGTYTGYSTICLAEGLQEGGKLITLEKNVELIDFAQEYFKKSGYDNNIELVVGDALDTLHEVEGGFDLVFIDANKKDYSKYYDIIIEKVNKGGYILADNVLWSGKVVDEGADKDADTIAIKAFNKKVHDDPRTENMLLTLRDGILIIKKL